MEEINEQELMEATNAEEGFQTAPAEEPAPQAETVNPTPEVAAPEAPEQGKSDFDIDALRGKFQDTPFAPTVATDPIKAVEDALKSWKSTSGEYSKLRETIKPIQTIVERAAKDAQYRQALEMADQLYNNPQLQRLYANPNADVPPDPRAYDLSDVSQYAQYQQDLANWNQKQAMELVNGRLREMETRTFLETQKQQFRTKYPDFTDDPDSMLEELKQSGGNINPYEAAYRLKMFDKLREQMAEQARKSVATHMQEAAKGKTPSAPTGAKGTVSANDVSAHIMRYGSESAVKKYGKEVVEQALRDVTTD